MTKTTSNTKRRSLANLEKLLYKASSVPELTKLYSEDLKKSNNLLDIELSSKMDEYLSTWVDYKFLRRLTKISKDIYKDLIQIPDLTFWFEGRRKAMISTVIKSLTYQSKNMSLDMVRDLIGFRIILLNTKDCMENIYRCYAIMQKVIRFCMSEGFIPCPHEPILETKGFDNSIHKLLIPNRSDIETYFKYPEIVKDYILNPKEKGYQSLHAIFRDPKTGKCFEIQIRTLSMHIRAEYGVASHDTYKDEKYSQYNFSFDRQKININGYAHSSEGGIIDFSGLEKSQQIFQRAVTF